MTGLKCYLYIFNTEIWFAIMCMAISHEIPVPWNHHIPMLCQGRCRCWLVVSVPTMLTETLAAVSWGQTSGLLLLSPHFSCSTPGIVSHLKNHILKCLPEIRMPVHRIEPFFKTWVPGDAFITMINAFGFTILISRLPPRFRPGDDVWEPLIYVLGWVEWVLGKVLA